MCTLLVQFRLLTCGAVLANFDLGSQNLLYLSMGFVKQQLSELHVLSKILELTQLCLVISTSLPYRRHQKIVCFRSVWVFRFVEWSHSAGLFINVVRPINVSTHKLLPVVFVSVQMSKRLTELRQSPSVYIWRLSLYLLLSVRIDSDPGFSGAFLVGDTSQYIGDNIVNRSIALHEPVIYVSANYRLNGMETLNDPV